MKMYRVSRFNIDIEEIEVKQAAQNSGGMNGPVTVARVFTHSRWFDTKAEAQNYLLRRTRYDLGELKDQVEKHEKWITQLTGMTL
jgi:hypothetical protein